MPIPYPGWISPRRLAANRANARRSTGPRTPEGKRRAAANSVTHGLTAEFENLPPNLRDSALTFVHGAFHEFAPTTPAEATLALQLGHSEWRSTKSRALQIEAFGQEYTTGTLELSHRLGPLSSYEGRNSRVADEAREALQALIATRGEGMANGGFVVQYSLFPQ